MPVFEDRIVTGRPEDVLAHILDTVHELIAPGDVTEFYIGRTVDPEATRIRHGAEELHLLYETSSLDFSMDVEDAIVKEYYEDSKCSNEEDSSAGGIPEDFDFCYVYVALWRVV